jgi:RNA polymerase sigma-70 factor, ECF subfamily
MQPANMDALRPGNQDDFDFLYQQTYRNVFQLCLAILRDSEAAQDCAQDAFVRAYRAWPRWQPDAPARAWIYRIAVNAARSHRRRRMFREIPATLDRLPDRTQHRDETLDLLEALRQLPRDEAAALVLRLHHGFSVPETAHILGVGERTVRHRVERGRERLAWVLGSARLEYEHGASVAVEST